MIIDFTTGYVSVRTRIRFSHLAFRSRSPSLSLALVLVDTSWFFCIVSFVGSHSSFSSRRDPYHASLSESWSTSASLGTQEDSIANSQSKMLLCKQRRHYLLEYVECSRKG